MNLLRLRSGEYSTVPAGQLSRGVVETTLSYRGCFELQKPTAASPVRCVEWAEEHGKHFCEER